MVDVANKFPRLSVRMEEERKVVEKKEKKTIGDGGLKEEKEQKAN